jgi:aspergillopepsin I
MPSIAPLAALASFAGLAFASPVKNIEKRAASTFRISEIQRGKSLNVGALALRKAYQKYGKIVPPKVEAAVSGISGSVIANAEQYDMEYLCPVSVGDATFHLDFDTGSADL